MAVSRGLNHVETSNLDVLVYSPCAYGVRRRLRHIEHGELWSIMNLV